MWFNVIGRWVYDNGSQIKVWRRHNIKIRYYKYFIGIIVCWEILRYIISNVSR